LPWLAFRGLFHIRKRVQHADIGIVTKYLVVIVFSVDQLKLIKLHVLKSLLQGFLLLPDLLLQVPDEFQILITAWSCVVHLALPTLTASRYTAPPSARLWLGIPLGVLRFLLGVLLKASLSLA
jgi:hypothetical protein